MKKDKKLEFTNEEIEYMSLSDCLIDARINKILFRAEMICNWTLTAIAITNMIWGTFDHSLIGSIFRIGVGIAGILYWFISTMTIHLARNKIREMQKDRYKGRAIEFKSKEIVKQCTINDVNTNSEGE